MSVQTRGYSGASYTHQSNNLEVVKRVLGGHSPPPPKKNHYKTPTKPLQNLQNPYKTQNPYFYSVFGHFWVFFFLGGGGVVEVHPLQNTQKWQKTL